MKIDWKLTKKLTYLINGNKLTKIKKLDKHIIENYSLESINIFLNDLFPNINHTRCGFHMDYCLSLTFYDYCCYKNKLDIIKWLHQENITGCTSQTLIVAALNGNLKMIKWLLENKQVNCPTVIMDYTASHGHLKVIKWLYENNHATFTEYTIACAASNGHYKTVKYLCKKIVPYTSLAIEYAAENGHLNIIQYLCGINSNVGCTTNTVEWATVEGHWEVAKWILENYTDIDCGDVMYLAVREGHFEFMIWLYEHKEQSFTLDDINAAATNGHLEIIKWLFEHGYLQPLIWLFENYNDNNNDNYTKSIMDWAARGGHLEVLKWLYEHTDAGCTTYAMDWAAEGGHLEVLKWLYEHTDAGCTTNALDNAIKYNEGWEYLEVIKWLHKNIKKRWNIKSYVCDSDIMDWLMANIYFEYDISVEELNILKDSECFKEYYYGMIKEECLTTEEIQLKDKYTKAHATIRRMFINSKRYHNYFTKCFH